MINHYHKVYADVYAIPFGDVTREYSFEELELVEEGAEVVIKVHYLCEINDKATEHFDHQYLEKGYEIVKVDILGHEHLGEA